MSIKGNMDIGKRIKQAREVLGISQTDIAKALGIEPSFLSNIESGKRNLSNRVTGILVYQYGISIDWLLSGNGEMFIANSKSREKLLDIIDKSGIKQLPVYSESNLPEGAFVVPLLDQQLCAGSGSQVPDEDASSALVRVPGYLSKYGDKVAALKVDGDSMYPTLSRGDMVVCDSCGWSGEGIYALRMSGSGFVKRLTKAPGKLIIISDNPKYPPREEPEESQDIQIIGRVHCAITKVE